jgi:hypothetical protein
MLEFRLEPVMSRLKAELQRNMKGSMNLSFPFRRAWPVIQWPGAAFCFAGLLMLAPGCQRGGNDNPAAKEPAAAAQAPATGTEAPVTSPETPASEKKPTPPEQPMPQPEAPKTKPPTPPEPPAASKADSRPAHLVALEKLGAVLDFGVGDRLIDVDLDGKPVTDADLDNLAPLTDLKILNLSGSRITDEGLAKLEPLKRLKFLYLFKTDITDAGLAHLKELPRLEVLCLDQTLITDAGIKSLEALPRLEKLHVHSRAPLTDKSIESLSKHVRLFELKVGGPGFTEQGIARLREALPNCKVQYDPKAEATEG